MKSKRNIILKATISVCLIVFILLKIDLKNLSQVLFSVKWFLFLLSFLLLLFQQVVIAYSWNLVLKAQGNHISFDKIIQIHFIGNFLGTFLPSSIGMDVIRAYSLSKHVPKGKGVDAASSMFILRMIGFLMLFALALVISLSMYDFFKDKSIIWTVGGMFLSFVLGIGIMVNSQTKKIIEKILDILRAKAIKDKLHRFYHAVMDAAVYRKVMFRIIMLSLFTQIIGIIIFYTAGLSLNISVPIIYYFLYIPVIQVIVLLPISIAGIGVREGAFVYFFTQLGVSRTQAFSLSLVVFSLSLCLAFIGGIIYWCSGILISRKK